ncbi:sporulation integral membrane protein YlbJ [Clostridium sp. UBA4548]|uniref:sporulation integral membrane protein YlbJ n=1 Tax=Clostridium sp. UBA4548 TaxID=1946361 RepID=UPI0025BF1C6E|nr:sporulation integral membrane protein YlbJ [Clostridium sp. UBA4548]
MKVILILTLIVIFSLIYLLLKNHDKNALLTFICSIIVVYIVLNPKQCIGFTIDGAKLFFNAVFPSLFPFLVIVNLIISFGGIEIYSRLLGTLLCRPLGLPKECSLVLLVSVFCGYPLGARYAAELYEQNLIDHKTLERLLNIATNGSPLFIIGSVGTAMLGHPSLGYILIISNILSCIVMGLLLPGRYKWKNYKTTTKQASTQSINLGVALKNALEDAVKTCISIGSFVIIFSVIINIIKSNASFNIALTYVSKYTNLPIEIFQSFTLGILEVTNGCNLIASSAISYDLKLTISSFLIAFSGLSITSQVYSLVYKHKISINKYILLKIIQGIVASLITLFICNMGFVHIAQDVFLDSYPKGSSFSPFLLGIIILITMPIIVDKLKSLIRVS